ncbi:MAG: hypothetical protein ACXVCY_18935 [Pseudobdellovibrionaceae bacterium]
MESKKSSLKRQTSLDETANEMFKAAFPVKKTRFAQENPNLSEEEINKMTALYFRKLAEENK